MLLVFTLLISRLGKLFEILQICYYREKIICYALFFISFSSFCKIIKILYTSGWTNNLPLFDDFQNIAVGYYFLPLKVVLGSLYLFRKFLYYSLSSYLHSSPPFWISSWRVVKGSWNPNYKSDIYKVVCKNKIICLKDDKALKKID